MNPYSLSAPLPEKLRHAARSGSARTSGNAAQPPAMLPRETPPHTNPHPAAASAPQAQRETRVATSLPQLKFASLYPIATATCPEPVEAMHATADAHSAKSAPSNTF